jgi:hypothetical protein
MKKRYLFVLGFALLITVLLIFLPSILKNYAINNSKELIGRQIDIGNLKYNYFSSTVQVSDFKMFEHNSQEHFATFDILILNLEPLKLVNDKLEIEQLYLKGLMLNAVMKDSTFNFDDLIAFHTQTDSIEIDTTKEKPFKYSISQIELKDANFFFDNQNIGKETHINDFSFSIPYIGWDQEKKSNADIKFNFKKGGYFESVLNINPVDGAFDAHFTIKDLYLEPFYEYVLEYANINSFKGILNSEIQVVGNTNDVIKSIISGQVNVNDFEMTDSQNKIFLSAQNIETHLKSIDNYNSSYTIESLKIDNSYSFFQLDSLSNNFFRVFKLDEAVSEENPTEASDSIPDSNLYYAINNLMVTNGVLDYSDNLTGQAFKYHLSDIKIDSDHIESTSKWIDIYSTMLLNNRGTLKANLGINPNDYLNSTLDIAVDNFLLPDLNIYTNYYMGHSILNGDMYYTSKSKLVDGKIESENKLLVKHASLENTKKGLYNLPLKFAFFLLTDKNGDINLDVPVSGNLNDPEVSVGKIVWQTFKNVIGKTVASPVNFLVGLVGGDPKDLEEISFSYTDSIPSEKQLRKFDKLISLEQKKPELKITMTYYVDENLQKQELAKVSVGKLFNQETNKDYQDNEDDFNTYVFNKVGTDSLSLNDAIKNLVSKTQLDSLVKSHKQRLMTSTKDYISQESSNTNIEIKESDLEAPENLGAYPKFLITYGMVGDKPLSINSKQ